MDCPSIVALAARWRHVLLLILTEACMCSRALVSATPRPYGQARDPELSSVPEPMAPLQYPLYKQSLTGAGPAQYPGSPR